MGMPEYAAKRYEGKVKDGNILMSVHTEVGNERDRAKKFLVRRISHYTGEASVPKDPKRADRL
jgi:hypothetical protein